MKASRFLIVAFSFLFPAQFYLLHGQAVQYTYFYRVYFKDKGASPSSYNLANLVSERAVKRRGKSGITSPDLHDVPVNSSYLAQVSAKGFVLHVTSRWMNSALFKTSLAADVNSILSLPFVKEVKLVKRPGIKSAFEDKLSFETVQSTVAYDRPLTQINGYALHDAGYTGKGILIAVLDGGFINADNIEALQDLRNRNGIIATRNLIQKNNLVYDANNHGTAVMSVLAGKIPGYLEGTAPEADFVLLKTEDVASEFPVEEDFWVAGAEYADSIGADVISSSLGYNQFDDPSMDYKQSDLDGNTAFVTQAADIAASKGILVVNSAGNERNKPWRKIIFPSDGDTVLAAGAVDANNIISTFSSAGPSADRRIKPDNCAMGVAVPVQTDRNYINKANGTSFSCPVLSGMTACLLQAIPKATPIDVIEALHQSGDRAATPDSLYGYGIPDMGMAFLRLQDKFLPATDEDIIAYPNPTTGIVNIIFRQQPGKIKIDIITIAGKILYSNNYSGFNGRLLTINELENHPQGMYFIRIRSDVFSGTKKIISIREK
jgi:subtilisin family serine protease